MMECSWVPVDTLASSILELAFPSPSSNGACGEGAPKQKQGQRQQLVYNLCNPQSFDWTEGFLPALSAAGLKFESVSFDEWLGRLKAYSASRSVEEAIRECPAVKLVEYYEGAYGGRGGSMGKGGGEVRFETDGAERECGSLRGGVDVIGSGLVGRMLGAWMEKWKGGERGGMEMGKGEGKGKVEVGQ